MSRALCLALALTAPACAQQPAFVTAWAEPHDHGVIAEINDDGSVYIDMRAVDATRADPAASPSLRRYADLIAAIRDGTWRPLRRPE